MPTLQRPRDLETTAPGLTRRRIWHAPAVRSHSLLTLTLAKLYLAPAGAAVKPETVKAIETGADLDVAFGPLATVIEVSKVKRVKLDLAANTLALEYVRPLPSGSGVIGVPTARVVIEFATGETADEVYAKLWRRLGDRLELQSHGRTSWDLARVPVAFMAGILLATLALSLAANAAADTGGAGGRLAPFASADWRLVCGIGGVALAGVQVWLYRRLTRPPTQLELGPKGSP